MGRFFSNNVLVTLPSRARNDHSSARPNAPAPLDVPIVYAPDVPAHTVSMLRADIDNACNERRHAQLHTD